MKPPAAACLHVACRSLTCTYVRLCTPPPPFSCVCVYCSEGLLGVVLEVTVRCDLQRLVANTYTNLPTDEIVSGAKMLNWI